MNTGRVTIKNDLQIGDPVHPAIKRKCQFIQLHMHVHVATPPDLQTHHHYSQRQEGPKKRTLKTIKYTSKHGKRLTEVVALIICIQGCSVLSC